MTQPKLNFAVTASSSTSSFRKQDVITNSIMKDVEPRYLVPHYRTIISLLKRKTDVERENLVNSLNKYR